MEFEEISFYNNMPAVNVKVYKRIDSVEFPLHLGSSYPVGRPDLMEDIYTDDDFTPEWIEENISEDYLGGVFWLVCEFGYEQLQDIAEEIFGEKVKVYAEGRSGGWAAIGNWRGSNEEEWSEKDLKAFELFSNAARVVADNIPHDMFVSIYLNEWEDHKING
jgi:hypothetical protein